MRLPVIEIMDTTLRDGEQTTGVSFTRSEKLSIFRLLVEELHIPRVEVASARVSSGEFETVKRICEWAKQNGHLDKAECWDSSTAGNRTVGYAIPARKKSICYAKEASGTAAYNWKNRRKRT